MVDEQNALLTTEEVCRELRISRWTLGRWIDSGKVAAKKIGRRVLIPKNEVERLLANSNAAITRGRPVSPDWFAQVSPEVVAEGAELLAVVLHKSGAQVNAEGLRPVLRGEEPPTPVFWNSLIAGLRLLLSPAGTLSEEANAMVDDHVKAWRAQGSSGRLWDPSTWSPEKDPKDHDG